MKRSNAGFGPEVNASQLNALLDNLLDFSANPEEGLWSLPLCIWGKTGIGKTTVIHDYAKEKNYPLVHLAPAQIEEMGDLLGMPAIEKDRTVFRKPAWAPTEKGPGILLLDDFNRADERIIKGLMQLLQEKKLLAWSLPPAWSIVLTANPESVDYHITSLDRALLTRMMHFTLAFDVQDWIRWAEKHQLPDWSIAFASARPELFEQERHTPRTFARFAVQTGRLKMTAKENPLPFSLLAESMLGKNIAEQLRSFLGSDWEEIPDALQLLTTDDFEKDITSVFRPWSRPGEMQRADLFSSLINRLQAYLLRHQNDLSQKELDNLKKLILSPELPSDIRFQLAQDWSNAPNPQLRQLISEPEVARLIL